VLRLADFRVGSGWKGGLLKNAQAFTSDTCPGLWDPKQSDLVITGAAESDFAGKGMRATSAVQVYKTVRMAELDWDRSVIDPVYISCLKQQLAAHPTPHLRYVSVKKTSFPRIGQRAAVRIRVVAEYSASGAKPVRVLMDQVALGRGRTGILISFTGPYAARVVADAAETSIAEKLVRRIRT
jgi:hypothetical protein